MGDHVSAQPGDYPRFRTEAGRERHIAAYAAALEAWPVAFGSVTVATSLGPTHVVVSGPVDAPPLILLHSLAATATVWRPNIAALSAEYRTYAVDVIGQPGRTRALRRLSDRRDYADWLVQVMRALGIERASIVGCSFGGFLALSQASLTPERIERVVLISPAGTFVGLSLEFVIGMRTASLRRRLRKLFGDTRPPDIAQLRPKGVRLDPADGPWRALMGVTMAERAQLSVINATVLRRRELRGVHAPTLLLIGDQERLYDPARTIALAKARMPRLEAAIVPDADHLAAMAQPEDVNARILRFLASR